MKNLKVNTLKTDTDLNLNAELETDISTAQLSHLPVLANEVLTALKPQVGKVIIDGTLGGAGHAKLLIQAGAKIIGIDQDPYALDRARGSSIEGLTLIEGNYRDMPALLENLGITQVDGILLDIGVSSFQLDDTDRGFSYHSEAALDMRMSQSGETAADIVNTYEEEEIASIIYEYGEDRLSRRIARGIVYAREKAPIETTVQLAEIIKRAYPGFSKGIHPARRTFQALRIHVNDELGALRDGLKAAEQLLKPEGRLAVISFHSLEDRIVKRFLLGSNSLESLTKRPIIATESEQETNPRARSAKLRSARKIAPKQS